MKPICLVIFVCIPLCLLAQRQDRPLLVSPSDSVQRTLFLLAQQAPALVGYIPETGRRFIKIPRSSALPDLWVERIQDAFFYDIHHLCKAYGRRYLADWYTLASKAARESFWGCSYLANRTFNYFGIRHRAKEWICDRLGFCGYVMRNDPEPAAFAVFPNFECSLWVFIHTIYSQHFLARLPDYGRQVVDAVAYERLTGDHYWTISADGQRFARQLRGYPYTAEELVYTWSGHAINNLCINCTWATDLEWVGKIQRAEERARMARLD